ncbi:unnamed protein product, partial [Arabidopsis halleri]
MASSSSMRYGIFLSFRGIDTRKTFIGHLYRAFVDRGIVTFKDDETITIGKPFPEEIRKAIQSSSFAVITISKNFASSKWCLIELQSIMELESRENYAIVPIFYGLVLNVFLINTSDLRDEEGNFLKPLKEGGALSSFVEQVPKWKEALKKVSVLQGKNPKNFKDDATMIKEIVGFISKELSSMVPIDDGDVVGMLPHVKRLLPRLNIDSEDDDARMIGIWGMGGIGKTTIAKYLFNRYSCRFSACCFMPNVRNICNDRDLVYLQEQFISKILPKEQINLSTVEQGRQRIKFRLGHQRVFVVLDDVNAINQIQAVAKEPSIFGPGSRIIITARDRQLLKTCGILEDDLYEVLCLESDTSLLMFKWYAFERGILPSSDAYEKLSIRASQLAHGLPYALEAFGLCFRGKSNISEWEDELRGLETTPHENTINILKISYKGLELKPKVIFLHIACLFNGYHIQRVRALFGDIDSYGIEVLEDKSLLNISTAGCIRMHALVEQTGKHIVSKNSKRRPPHKQMILWDPQDICEVLRCKRGTYKIQCLALHMCKMSRTLDINCTHFMLMYNLRFLKFYKHLDDIASKLQFVPEDHLLPFELRLFHWDAYPSRTLPVSLHLDCLVEINLRYSNLERLWDGTPELVNLRKLDVKESKNLRELPDISKAKKLEDLVMDGCTGLERFPVYIGSLSNLVELHATRCGTSFGTPCNSMQPSVEIHLELQQLILKFPNEVEPVISLENLSIEGKLKFWIFEFVGDADHFSFNYERPQPPRLLSSIRNLKCLKIKRNKYNEDDRPFRCRSFSNFPFLTQLNLINLKITNIPSSIGEVKSLEKLNLSGNDFKNLPKTVGKLSKLKYLLLCECRKLEVLPQLTQVETLILSDCINLQSLLDLSTLEEDRGRYGMIELDLDNCNNVQSLSDDLSHFTNLKELNLSGHDFVTVPKCIKELSSLKTLALNNCKKLESLEELPLSLKCLHAHGCHMLENVSLSSDHSFEDVDLHHCFNLKLDDHVITQLPLNSHGEKVTSRCGCSQETEIPSLLRDIQATTSHLSIRFPLINPTHMALV